MRIYSDVLKSLLPYGLMWKGKNLAKLMDGLSGVFDRISIDRDSLFTESLPINAVSLLPDWERILNIHTTSNDITARQQKAAAIFSATGGNTEEFYLSIARFFDPNVTLLKNNPTLNFTAGKSVAGVSLGRCLIPKFTAIFVFNILQNNDVFTILEKLKPAHVQFIYQFKETTHG